MRHQRPRIAIFIILMTYSVLSTEGGGYGQQYVDKDFKHSHHHDKNFEHSHHDNNDAKPGKTRMGSESDVSNLLLLLGNNFHLFNEFDELLEQGLEAYKTLNPNSQGIPGDSLDTTRDDFDGKESETLDIKGDSSTLTPSNIEENNLDLDPPSVSNEAKTSEVSALATNKAENESAEANVNDAGKSVKSTKEADVSELLLFLGNNFNTLAQLDELLKDGMEALKTTKSGSPVQ